MESIYSILYIPIRPDIQERLSIGLLLSNGEKVFFKYSKNKLEVVKKLFNDLSFKIIKESINNIELSATKINAKFNSSGNAFKEEDNISEGLFSERYIEYLSRYNNNLLTFSSPKQIDINPNIEIFQTLYKKFVDDINVFEKESQLKVSKFENYKYTFLPKVKNYYNTEQEVTSVEIPKLIMPIRVDMIGKNNIEVFGQSVDMEGKRLDVIQNDISDILFLKNAEIYIFYF